MKDIYIAKRIFTKLFLFTSCLLILTACHKSSKSQESYTMGILRGPSAIAFAEWLHTPPVIDGNKLTLKVFDSPEVLQGAIIKNEVQISALPMLNAVNLYNKNIDIKLLGCPIWGTLYVIGKAKSIQDVKEIYVFAQGTSPDILTQYFMKTKGINPKYNYSKSTQIEIVNGFSTNMIENAVCSEPFISYVLKMNSSLKVLADLNCRYDESLDSTDYFSQTAVICSKSLYKYKDFLDEQIKKSCIFANKYPLEAIKLLIEKNVFKAGLITESSVKRSRIDYVKTENAKAQINNFLSIIYNFQPKILGGKMPDSSFYQ